ncbi:DUF3822 family protein [Pedobacter sp. SD-b]|uniref:DUF3822 family protein n=1 Tax=Pedobacter segetis TaxID=2793069 RepID=A0ABS1BHV5_9SPHI|nr:DUF3822 family protein [Pedobacter segetis]MBK0382474.1 DUF3822 family protein [Pedobacter segetis]
MSDKIILSVDGFENLSSKELDLYLEISLNSYNYAIIDPEDKSVKSIAHKPSVIFNDLSDLVLQANFSKTKISLPTQKFTFIPTGVYHKKDLENYAKYIQPADNEKVFTHALEKSGITVIYALPELLLDKLGASFPNAEIFPQLMPFYQGITFAFSQINSPQLFINVKPGFVEVIILNDHRFKFYNVFEYQNDDELLYFALLAAQQNKLRPANLTVKVSGNTDWFGDTFKKIVAQFPRTEVTDQDSLPLFYNGLGQPVMPRFFSLLSLHLCE